MSAARTELQERIAQKEAAIAELEPRLEQAKAESKDAAHALNVQLRYSSRLQNVLNPPDAFQRAMAALIAADKAVLGTRGK